MLDFRKRLCFYFLALKLVTKIILILFSQFCEQNTENIFCLINWFVWFLFVFYFLEFVEEIVKIGNKILLFSLFHSQNFENKNIKNKNRFIKF